MLAQSRWHRRAEVARPVKVVQASELQLELESLAKEIQKDKERWAKKAKEEAKLQSQHVAICDGILEKQTKVAQLEAELAKRMAATAPAPTQPAPTPAPPPPALAVAGLPAFVETLKADYGHSIAAADTLSEPTKAIGKEIAEFFATIDKFTGISCRWHAAVSQELSYHRGIVSTDAPPLNATGHELIQNRSPERTAHESTEPAPQQQQQQQLPAPQQLQQHPVLEPAIPPPLPGLQLAQPPVVSPPLDGTGGAAPSDEGVAPMQTDGTAEQQDPKRKAPFDEEGFQRVMAVARAGQAKGEGKGCDDPAAKKGKTDDA